MTSQQLNSVKLSLMKEFNILKKQAEEIAYTSVNDELYDFYDKICNEKLQLVDKVAKDLLKTMDKIKDYNTIMENADEYLKNHKIVNQTYEETMDYLHGSIELENEIREIILPKLNPTFDKMKTLIASSSYYGCFQIANIMKFEYKKFTNQIFTDISSDAGSALSEYKRLICDVINTVNNRIDLNYKNVLEYYKQENNEVVKKKLKKILDCRQMDKYMNENGYEPIRQTGGHKIYIKGSKTIPVPQHSKFSKNLGYGIQKQML